MRKLILLAGALVMASATPALAKPGHGKGNAHAGTHSKNTNHGRVTAADRNGNGIADFRERRGNAADRNGNGIADVRERRGANGCPPGLAKKNNGCLPPGQARKSFTTGQRIPSGYALTRYRDIPASLRDRVPAGQSYILRDQTLYVVDPATRLVTSIVNLVR